MSKLVKIVFAFFIGISSNFSQQSHDGFKGDLVIVTGDFARLNVIQSDIGRVELVINSETSRIKSNSYKVKENPNVLEIIFKDKNQTFELRMPKGMSLKCQPNEFITKAEYSFLNSFRIIDMQELNNEIEINADAYNLRLVDLTGPLSVVTYGHIEGSFSDMKKGQLISLDTYMGDINLQVPDHQSGQLMCNARNGQVIIAESLKENYNAENINGDVKLMLNSENGKLIELKNINENSNAGANEAFIDALVKMNIESRGRSAFYDETAKKFKSGSAQELADDGYAEFIMEQPIYSRYDDFGKSHRSQVVKFIEAEGFPQLSTFGESKTALNQFMVVLGNNQDLMEKYAEEFIELFGEKRYNKFTTQ